MQGQNNWSNLAGYTRTDANPSETPAHPSAATGKPEQAAPIAVGRNQMAL